MTNERIMNDKELKDAGYTDLVKLAKIFNHDIVDCEGVYRWKSTAFSRMLVEGLDVHVPPEWKGPIYNTIYKGGLDLNYLWSKFYTEQIISTEEMMRFYMQIGYSLSGFLDIFDKSAKDMNLCDDEEIGCIEYILDKYKGSTVRNI